MNNKFDLIEANDLSSIIQLESIMMSFGLENMFIVRDMSC